MDSGGDIDSSSYFYNIPESIRNHCVFGKTGVRYNHIICQKQGIDYIGEKWKKQNRNLGYQIIDSF